MSSTKKQNLAQLYIGIDEVTPELLQTYHTAGVRPALWGGVGIGKTDVCQQLAAQLTQQAREHDPKHPGWKLLHRVVSHLAPEEISGLQIIDKEKLESHATRPAFMGAAGQRYVILLDEYTRAPQSYRNVLLQFVLSGAVGDHKVHPDTIIMLAGNPTGSDVVGLQRLSYADRNRVLHLNIHTNYEIWSKWALAHNVHPWVIGYLLNNPQDLQTTPTEASNEGFASPRTWAMLSALLQQPYFVYESQVEGGLFIYNPKNKARLFISANGLVGNVSTTFFAYVDTLANLPSPENMLQTAYFPKSNFGLQYGAIVSVTNWLSQKNLLGPDGTPTQKSAVVNLTDARFLQFITLTKQMTQEMRMTAFRLLYRGTGKLFPNRPLSPTNPTLLEASLGSGATEAERDASPARLELRKVLEEFISALRT